MLLTPLDIFMEGAYTATKCAERTRDERKVQERKDRGKERAHSYRYDGGGEVEEKEEAEGGKHEKRISIPITAHNANYPSFNIFSRKRAKSRYI